VICYGILKGSLKLLQQHGKVPSAANEGGEAEKTVDLEGAKGNKAGRAKTTGTPWWHNQAAIYGPKLLSFVESLLFYKMILAVFLFGFMEFVISGHFGSRKEAIMSTAAGETMQIFFVWLGLSGAFIGLPMLYYWLYKASFSYKKFSFLQYTVKAHLSIYNFLFYPLYMCRRLAYVLIVWYVEHPVFQFFWMMVLNYLALVYIGWHNPLLTRLQNWVEYYNQLSIVLVTLHMCMFTDWVGDREV